MYLTTVMNFKIITLSKRSQLKNNKSLCWVTSFTYNSRNANKSIVPENASVFARVIEARRAGEKIMQGTRTLCRVVVMVT